MNRVDTVVKIIEEMDFTHKEKEDIICKLQSNIIESLIESKRQISVRCGD